MLLSNGAAGVFFYLALQPHVWIFTSFYATVFGKKDIAMAFVIEREIVQGYKYHIIS